LACIIRCVGQGRGLGAVQGGGELRDNGRGLVDAVGPLLDPPVLDGLDGLGEETAGAVVEHEQELLRRGGEDRVGQVLVGVSVHCLFPLNMLVIAVICWLR
jgi:hypothetical protein